MEIYLAAIVSFYIKPRRRLWIPDGIESLIEITTPKFVEVQRTKDLSQSEAERRLSYLADIADTGGWAIRHSADPFAGTTPLASDAFYAAQQTEDVLGEEGGIAHSFEAMISQADQRRKQDMIARMHQPTPDLQQPVFSPPVQQQASPSASPQTTPDPSVTFDPYPTEIHQRVINPLGTTPAQQPVPTPSPSKPIDDTPITTSEKPISPDIINLASNPDLSIETIQREASRIQHKEALDDGDEVVITLR
jgi:hypothetical protein